MERLFQFAGLVEFQASVWTIQQRFPSLARGRWQIPYAQAGPNSARLSAPKAPSVVVNLEIHLAVRHPCFDAGLKILIRSAISCA